MKQYWNIKAKYSGMMLFFRLGDFYEMFGDDAVKAAPVLEVVLTRRVGIPMCGVPYHSVNSYIRKLITKGFKVAICEQLEESGTTKGIVKRGVTKVLTPGTILEDTLLESKENNFLMSVIFDDTAASATFAAADISTGEFFVSETTLKSIEAEVLKYNPGELIISAGSMQNKHISDFTAKLKVTVSDIDNSFFDIEKAQNITAELFGGNAVKKFGLNKKEIVCACGALLAYIKEMQPQSVSIFSEIKYIRNSDFMYLDTAAIKNLELLNSMTSGKTENSLLSVMDSTKTPMGARTIRQWLIKPLLDISKIKNRQNIVRFFIKNPNVRKEIVEKLKTVSDIERITARVSSGSANPKDLTALKNSLKTINNISEIIKSAEGLGFNIPENAQITNKISSYLSDEPPVSVKDGNVIKNGVAAELDELRKISTDTKAYISNLEAKERATSGINNLKIGYTSVFGYYIEISKSNAASAPKHYVRKQTVTAGERYITEELKILEEKILSAQEKTLRLENSLFNNLVQEISVFTADILKTSQIISEIDIFCGFAENATEYNYVCPKISEGRELSIKDGRHPVVERILKNGEFTANDIAFDENSKIMILTGPNMSGKSTYLRQTALIVIMAQIGSFVPSQSAEIGLVDKIFTRIGAGDNLAGGESTFMVEMSETANIMNQYTQRSLIILDEVGRGTSTYDGMSIAWAIIEFFADDKRKANTGAKILFATHYFELTGLSETLKGVVNYSVDIKEWNGDVIFLHKIVKGSADKSYGIYVAKIAGMPHQVIERAYEILSRLEKNSVEYSKRDESPQIEFFSDSGGEPQILTELKNIDIDSLSPIEAFNIMHNWKNKYK
ncbi:DNA mismatch repair protein MutS [Endomicrobiia bacterium]|nr:DNA mismatch repair protein MutS [Endomicrobiia bacterium]GHT10836.1 DNA mismatch repair protein MutS [Endomicrobiia bacterium]GHT20751.1 DNA mismatch repair protein MutS [Endomicrobiia bacterium]GHT25940.1 DNA mismatch repair protein MutS [Endomicrobiia bacterium]GHT32377.1 DNA mismatch repair protein MutS [Endomicrobiia bacterium]